MLVPLVKSQSGWIGSQRKATARTVNSALARKDGGRSGEEDSNLRHRPGQPALYL